MAGIDFDKMTFPTSASAPVVIGAIDNIKGSPV